MPLGFANLTWGTNLGRAGLGSSGVAGSPAFSLSDLQNDSNVVLVQDPSAILGASDMLARRNLLTYTEDFSNAAWVKTAITATSTGFLETAATSIHQLFGYNAATAVVAGRKITLIVRLQGVGRDWALVGLAAGPAGSTAGYRRYVNLNTGEFGASGGVYGAVSNASASASISPFGGVDVVVTCSFDASDPNGAALIYSASADGTVTFLGDITKGLNVSNCGIYVSSTIDQSYQKITDWTTEQYAWAAQKNVPWLRRNMFQDTENIQSSYWTKAASSASTAAKLLEAATTGAHYLARAFTPVSGVTYEISVEAEAAERTFINVSHNFGGAPTGAYVNLSSGEITTKTGDGIITATLVSSGKWRISIITTVVSNAAGFVYFIIAESGSNFTYAGDITKGLFLRKMQIVAAASATPYQPIGASWPATYTTLAQAAGYPISMYSDRAGTTATDYSDVVVGKLLDLSGDNNHATAPSDAARPLLKKDANGKWYLLRDGVDDNLPITFPSLGSNCVTYVCDGTQVVKTTGVTLNGTHNTTTPTNDYGRIYCAAPPTAAREAQIIKYLKAKSGIA